jgi:hypothetical protein
MPRQYIRLAAGFVHEGVFVQINPYFVSQGVLDGDGLYGDAEFDSLNDLAAKSGWSRDQMTAFIDTLKTLTA